MKPDEEEKARQRAAELEKLKQSLFISNKSTDPRLVTAAVQPSLPFRSWPRFLRCRSTQEREG
jgi:hypothetical protein